ncbi:inhibitory synaptic factor 1 [Pristis pectinata]|uniref:inhibitory synaptic factor 1 n=1 Tax=Pristis pectinata TaxID=685728 RepID=UPI00223D4834|nr:inhibitory synaptic factor 1 [Pristis pectinata]XP_051898578.1 inhibitory synaptic factor 1 [Pristis pectinata]XP_051898580.1 inhibitory synaptic factor 1 [Pristis pectinata]
MSSRVGAPQESSETSPQPSVREAIRNRMKMVIDQLEVILEELKAVAKELKEVVKQIDKLTSDFDFELEPDDWTIATISSTSSSDTTRNHERCGALSDYGQLGFLTPDILSDSWEFCSFLELPPEAPKGDPGGDDKELLATPSEPDYRLMNGGLIPNGPTGCGPDSSSEETISGAPCHKTLPRTSGTRERVRFSDKVLYHALCCDDEEEEQEESNTPTTGTATTAGEGVDRVRREAPKSPSSASNSRPHSHPPTVTAKSNPSTRKKVMRNNSTQTVSHKSTQTLLSYGPCKTQPDSKKGDTK